MEVVLDVNGSWNRICAYDAFGRSIWAVNLGPSLSTPFGYTRDVGIADTDGDGSKEIVIATVDGIVSCFRHDGTQS